MTSYWPSSSSSMEKILHSYIPTVRYYKYSYIQCIKLYTKLISNSPENPCFHLDINSCLCSAPSGPFAYTVNCKVCAIHCYKSSSPLRKIRFTYCWTGTAWNRYNASRWLLCRYSARLDVLFSWLSFQFCGSSFSCCTVTFYESDQISVMCAP